MITGKLQDRLLASDDQILAEDVFDCNGQLRMYHPTVQNAVFNLIREDVLAELKAERAKKEEAKKGK